MSDHAAILATITTHRDSLIAELCIDPVAAVQNLRHNFFSIFAELKGQHPSMGAGDVHHALKQAQQADWESNSEVNAKTDYAGLSEVFTSEASR